MSANNNVNTNNLNSRVAAHYANLRVQEEDEEETI